MKARCYDKSFKYVPAAATNIKATFARIRRDMKQAASKAQAEADAEAKRKVAPIRKAK